MGVFGAERRMGKLVRFDRSGRPISAHNAKTGEAQILLFTGVRYERNATAPAPKRRATKRKQKRG